MLGWPVLIITVILVLLKCRSVVEYLMELRRKRKFASSLPGPEGAFLLGNVLQISTDPKEFGNNMLQMCLEMVEKGEHVLRLWMGFGLCVCPLDGDAIKPILNSNTEISKGHDYDCLIPWLGTGLLLSSGDKWKSRRRMLTPTFHFRMLEGYISAFAFESKVLVTHLEKYANTGKEVDIFPFLKRCALDIICRTAMGIELNAQEEYETPYIKAVNRIGVLNFEHAMKPWIRFAPVWYLTGRASEFAELVKTLTGFTGQVIRERSAIHRANRQKDIENKKELSFLDMLLDMQEENKLTNEDIQEEVGTFMFAGHDTTSTGAGWTLWCLATHPDIQEKVVNELDTVIGDANFTIENLKKLRYLELCIKEAMRLFPPVPFVTRTLINDLQIDGKVVPRGAICLIAPFVLHRNPKIYQNVNDFNPENFLPEKIAERHPFSYIPFSAGPRNCLGQKFALLEEKTLVASVLRKFKISTAQKMTDKRFTTEMVMMPEEGFPLRLERR